MGRIGGDGVGMFAWVKDDVGHRSFLPAVVDRGVAFGAGCGAAVVSRGESGRLNLVFVCAGRAKRADEGDEGPGVVGRGGVVGDSGGHACELDAVFDDVVKIAVGEMLRRGRAKVGDARVEVGADGRASAAIDAVADGAAGQEGVAPLLEGARVLGQRVFELALVAGDGGVADGARDVSFPTRWSGGGTETMVDGKREEEHGCDGDED